MQPLAWDNSYKMLLFLKRHFTSGRARLFDSTGMHRYSVADLRGELLRITDEVLHQAGVDPACVSLSVEQVGAGEERRPTLRSMVDLVRWDQTSAVRLLLGVGHIERAVRRKVGAGWVGEGCQYAGVWVHPSDAILQSQNLKHLAAILGVERDSTWHLNSMPDAYAPTAPSHLREP